jgi:ABC-type sugar transport system substrate-binding protein
MRNSSVIVLALAVLARTSSLAAAAGLCKLPAPWDSQNDCIDRKKIKVISITHGGLNNGFWDVVEDSMLRAKRDFGVDLDFRTPPQPVFDSIEMSKMVVAAAKELKENHVDENGKVHGGLIVSVADDRVANAIKEATDMGVGVYSINTVSENTRMCCNF